MKTVKLREAKAGLSAIVQAAEDGETTIITKHGKPAARVVPIEEAREQKPTKKKMNFGEFLLTFPGGVEFERNTSPSRDIDF
jgi:prevent-host-death family protein